MRLSQVCIDRPVLSTVMCLMILLFGAISLPRIPNRELPDIDAPRVSIISVYPGAAAEVVETSVTQPIEEAVNGIEGVKHVTSSHAVVIRLRGKRVVRVRRIRRRRTVIVVDDFNVVESNL